MAETDRGEALKTPECREPTLEDLVKLCRALNEIDGVPIPFASPQTLWRMKQTVRDKDIPDRLFLRQWHAAHGIALDPPLPAAGPAPANDLTRAWRHLRDWWRGC